MDGLEPRGERGFLDRFGKGRVGVADAGKVLRRALRKRYWAGRDRHVIHLDALADPTVTDTAPATSPSTVDPLAPGAVLEDCAQAAPTLRARTAAAVKARFLIHLLLRMRVGVPRDADPA